MKHLLIVLGLTLLYLNSNAQLTKGNWLVGGTGKFDSYKINISSAASNVDAKYTEISLSPAVGYFVIDKLAFGARPTFTSIKGKSIPGGNIFTNTQRYWLGPFGRYYFLEKDNPYNIVADLSYQFGFLGGKGAKGQLRTFSALAGPVIYFNTSVGIELLLGYSYRKEDSESSSKALSKGFQIAAGFQIHLEK